MFVAYLFFDRGGYGLDEEELKGIKGLETELHRNSVKAMDLISKNLLANPEFEMSQEI